MIEAIIVLELPETIDVDRLYLIGESEFYYEAALKCPCGCGDIIELNLLEGSSPKWKIVSKNPLTVTPSIQRTINCKSHFRIVKGVFVW